MERHLFTFTAYYLGEPVWVHQGYPSYHSASTFHCRCGKSKIDLPHSSIITRPSTLWPCPLPLHICGRIYTFVLEYPNDVLGAEESINVKLNRLQQSAQSLQDQQIQADAALIGREGPVRDAVLRQEDLIVVMRRAYQQLEGVMQLREETSDAFERLEKCIWRVNESLDGLNDRAENAIRKADRTWQHVRDVETATVGNGNVLQRLQEQVGAMGNLGQMIRQINPNDGIAHLQQMLLIIDQNVQQIHVNVGPVTDTCDAVRGIQEQLKKYNKRYDKSIGVIIG